MSKFLGAMTLSLTLLAAVAATAPNEAPHFGLKSSTPEADASVKSPSQIRLTFTQEPQEGSTSIRLVEAEQAGVHVMDVARDSEDPTTFYIELHGVLPPGAYTVAWRGIGADGHVIRDDFRFTVVAD